MKKFWEKVKKIDYRHYICLALVLGSLACAVFAFPKTVSNTVLSGKGLCNAVVEYVNFLFQTDFSGFSDEQLKPSESAGGSSGAPDTVEDFKDGWNRYWKTFADGDNAVRYFSGSLEVVFQFLRLLLLFLPVVLLLVLCCKLLIKPKVTKARKISKPLQWHFKLAKKVYRPAAVWLRGFGVFVMQHGRVWLLLGVLAWLYSFGAFNVFLSVCGLWMGFAASFSLIQSYKYVYVLLTCLWALIRTVPIPVWGVIGYAIFAWLRRRNGFWALRRQEAKCRAFLNSLPLVVMVCGTMGTGKTTMLTDMCLTTAVMFRDRAKSMMREYAMQFPAFPWQAFEDWLADKQAAGELRNWKTAEALVNSLRDHYAGPATLFGYDAEVHGYNFVDGLKRVDLFRVLRLYAKLYFLYTLPGSLMVGNFAIREDGAMVSAGNFPKWREDFFNKSVDEAAATTHFSRNLDFDVLRPGRKKVPETPLAGSFEFGVLNLTEIGKERGNKETLEGQKKKDAGANQKNDLFNLFLKMIRHPATVDTFSFVRFFTDDQRPESWAADARDLTQLVHIRERCPDRLVVPGFGLFNAFYDWACDRLAAWYDDFRFRRGDRTLYGYLKFRFASGLFARHLRIWNTFGFHYLEVETERGTQDGEMTAFRYPICHRKVYALRYETACYVDFFRALTVDPKAGILDYPAYASSVASWDELKAQHSYFIDEIVAIAEESQNLSSDEAAQKGDVA